MNRNVSVILIVLIIVGGIMAFVYYKKNYFPKYNWTEDYKRTSDQPYGLKLFYSVLKDQKVKTNFIFNRAYETLDTVRGNNNNFISIGNEFWMDSIDIVRLLKFVERGNRVLIASNYSPLQVLREFVPIGDTIQAFQSAPDSLVSISYEKELVPYPTKSNFHYMSVKDTLNYNWGVYTARYFNDTLRTYHFSAFSFLNDSNITAFYVQHGKGKIFVHANPVLFTNYYLVRQNGFEHANNFLSQMHKGTIYWDEPYTGQGNMHSSPQQGGNPLKFLFSHAYLKWAWYLFLATVFLYLVFRSKREQRVIPLLPVNTNSSIEYSKAIGTLYFQNKGHHHIANEMYIVFLAEVRSRYNIPTDMSEEELSEQISTRSGIAKKVIDKLFKQFNEVRNNVDARSDELIDLYDAIEYYHKKRK